MRRGLLMKRGRTNDIPNPNAFRTESMDGEFAVFPRKDGFFSMTGESLTPGGSFRLMQTSIIKDVSDPVPCGDGRRMQVDFETQNSLYRLVYEAT
jgi:hypothetical protein